MSFRVLATALHDALSCPSVQELNVVWHGGEVTVLPIDYVKRALWLEYQFKRPGQRVFNSLQTNATRLTPEWISLFRAFNITVGVSIDGPPALHDRRRVDLRGHGTSARVRDGIRLLQASGVQFGCLVVVDRAVADAGAEVLLSYLVELGVKGVALLNVIPDISDQRPDEQQYLPWPEFVQFLTSVFRVWWAKFRGRIVVRELDSFLSSIRGGAPTTCEFAGNCMGQFLTIEPSGDVSACDKFVGSRDYLFGNLTTELLSDIAGRSARAEQARRIGTQLAAPMRRCEHFRICAGGCPHDMIMNRRHVMNWEGNCCGLAPLLGEILESVAGEIGDVTL